MRSKKKDEILERVNLKFFSKKTIKSRSKDFKNESINLARRNFSPDALRAKNRKLTGNNKKRHRLDTKSFINDANNFDS